MFLYIANEFREPTVPISSFKTLLRAIAAALALGLLPLQAGAAELVMLEQPGCAWCARFNAEIAPGYEKSEEGERAPLRRVDITEPIPDDLDHIAIERFTPTFILIDDGREIDRLRGYPGDEFFWPLIGEMLQKLDRNPGDENG